VWTHINTCRLKKASRRVGPDWLTKEYCTGILSPRHLIHRNKLIDEVLFRGQLLPQIVFDTIIFIIIIIYLFVCLFIYFYWSTNSNKLYHCPSSGNSLIRVDTGRGNWPQPARYSILRFAKIRWEVRHSTSAGGWETSTVKIYIYGFLLIIAILSSFVHIAFTIEITEANEIFSNVQ